jgi:hypothetical protein
MQDLRTGLRSEDLEHEVSHAADRFAGELAAQYDWPRDELRMLIRRRHIVQGVAEDVPAGPRQGLHQMNATFKVVVRDDLLAPVGYFLKLSKGCAALSGGVAAWLALGTSVATVGVLAAALADLYDVFKKVWDLAHRLTQDEWAVVCELARSEVQQYTLDGLAKALPSMSRERILDVLTKFEIGPGKPSNNFVKHVGDSWQLVGV